MQPLQGPRRYSSGGICTSLTNKSPVSMWIWQFLKDAFEKLTQWWGGLEARLEHGLSSQECSVTSSLEPQPSLIWTWLPAASLKLPAAQIPGGGQLFQQKSWSLTVLFPRNPISHKAGPTRGQGRHLPEAQRMLVTEQAAGPAGPACMSS